MKKIFAPILAIALASSTLTGCLLSSEVLNGSNVEKTYRFIQDDKDTVASFAFDKQQNKLVMIGDKYVYVFDNTPQLERLKAILANPKLDKKRMYWNIALNFDAKDALMDRVAIDKNHNFEFYVNFQYAYQNEAEAKFFESLNFLNDKKGKLAWINGWYDDHKMVLTGKMYQDNSATTQALRKDAQALSKRYEFAIGHKNTDRNFSNGIKKVAFLPFALVADVVTAPVQILFIQSMKNFHP